MSYRIGNNYKLAIELETTYGTPVESSATFLPDVCEMKDAVAKGEVPANTGTLLPQATGVQPGYKTGTVTIKGALSDAHEVLLPAMLSASSPYVMNPSQKTNYSYTIYQILDESTDDTVHRATGCVCESFKITGEGGGVITYEATFKTDGAIDREETIAGGLTYTTPTVDPFLFADTTCIRYGGVTAYNSFSLDIGKTFADDKNVFQNSNTKTFEAITSTNATMNMEWNYDTAADASIYDTILDDTCNVDSIVLNDGSNSWTLTTYGKYDSYDSPDPDKGIYIGNFVKGLLYDGTNQPLTITIT
ncbi:MAG: hypothetical protein HOG49_01120 [Candidatus Scalindua sp.]|nr:hypothetical protein [Candidatus Scalindua sp.]